MAKTILVALLLLLPYLAMMWVPSYNHAAPEIAGIPFFYWYQLAWVPAGSLLLLIAYWITRGKDARDADEPPAVARLGAEASHRSEA